MSAERIIDAIGNISEEYIEEYAALKSEHVTERIKKRRVWSVAAAACAAVVVIAGAAATVLLVNKAGKQPDGKDGYDFDNHQIVEATDEPETIDETQPPTFLPTEAPEMTESAETVTATEPAQLPTAEPRMTEGTETAPGGETAPPSENIQERETAPPVMNAEKDWKGEWRYFITRLAGEQGKGVTASPDDKESVTKATDSLMQYSDEYFIANSLWVFECNYQNRLYRAVKSRISKEDIGAYIQDIDLSIYERALKNYNFKETAALFSVHSISPDAALAVRISADEYCLMVNTDYQPDSFQDFVSDFHLLDTADLKEIAYFDAYGNVAEVNAIEDDTRVWEVLSETAGAAAAEDVSGLVPFINVSMDSDYYAFYDVSFSVYREGYLYFNVFGNRLCFTIDANAAAARLK